MASANVIKLLLQTFADTSGYDRLVGATKKAIGNTNDLSRASRALGGVFGTVGAGIGKMVGGFLQGSIWGVAVEGVKLLIDHFDLFGKKAAEARKKQKELADEARKSFGAINDISAKTIANIDKEARHRQSLSDIMNRQYKAELELQRAAALRTGDLAKARDIEREMAGAERQNAVDKADAEAKAAERKVAEAKRALDAAQKQARDAQKREADAEAALEAKSKPVLMVMQATPGAYAYMTKRDTTKEKSNLEIARKDVAAADDAVDKAKEAYDVEVEKWRVAKESAKTVAKEQKAAAEKEFAERVSAEKKAVEERNKAERNRLADQQKREAETRKREEYEASKAELELERQRRIASGESRDAVNGDIDSRLAEVTAAEKRRIAKASQLREPEKLKKAEAEIEAERLKRAIATEDRKRKIRLEAEREMLQHALDANTERANDLREKLKNAQQAAAKAAAGFGGTLPGGRGVLGLDAPDDLKDERRRLRQEKVDGQRLAKAAGRLKERTPNWRTARNLSRQDEQARRWLLAKENERKIAEEQRRVERERKQQAKDISDILNLLKRNMGL